MRILLKFIDFLVKILQTGSEVFWELRDTFDPNQIQQEFSIAYVYAERWLITEVFWNGFKIIDHILANSAMSNKNNMAVDQLADSEETELRIEQTTGCPIIMFKHTPARYRSYG